MELNELNKMEGECSYHLCRKKTIVYECPYCGKYFCGEHIKPKIPMPAPFRDSNPEMYEEWGGEGHPCPDYVYYKKIKDEEDKVKSGITLAKLSKDSINKKAYESPYPTKSELYHHRKKKVRRNKIKLLKLSNLSKIFISAFVAFILLWWLILPIIGNYNKDYNEELEIISLMVLGIAELAGLLLLLFKLDQIEVYSTLRIWGLKLLSGILVIIGAFLLALILVINIFVFPVVSESSELSFLVGELPFLIPAFGLVIIGGYLEFKYMTKSGIIIHRGSGW